MHSELHILRVIHTCTLTQSHTHSHTHSSTHSDTHIHLHMFIHTLELKSQCQSKTKLSDVFSPLINSAGLEGDGFFLLSQYLKAHTLVSSHSLIPMWKLMGDLCFVGFNTWCVLKTQQNLGTITTLFRSLGLHLTNAQSRELILPSPRCHLGIKCVDTGVWQDEAMLWFYVSITTCLELTSLLMEQKYQLFHRL